MLLESILNYYGIGLLRTILTSVAGDWHELTKTDNVTTPYDTETNPSETKFKI